MQRRKPRSCSTRATTNQALLLLSEAGVPHGGDIVRGVKEALANCEKVRQEAAQLKEALMQSLTMQGLAVQALQELSLENRASLPDNDCLF